jgi:hypothetical protein
MFQNLSAIAQTVGPNLNLTKAAGNTMQVSIK